MNKERDIARLVAQRVALNERWPDQFCNFCDNKAACLYDNLIVACPLELKDQCSCGGTFKYVVEGIMTEFGFHFTMCRMRYRCNSCGTIEDR